MGRGDGGSCKRRKTNDTSKTNGGSSGAFSSRGPPPRDVAPMDHVLATNAALRDCLASLGATRPSYVMEKRLKASDVHRNQARLLFSCKGRLQLHCPLAACFTAAEARRVADMGDGLLVTALDRAGRSYDLKCKYLVSNHAYRFITGWKAFVQANGLALNGGDFRRDVRVELWAFRSRALPNRFVEKDTKKVYEETGDPDGALGLVLLHYENAIEDDGKDEAGMMAVVEEEPVTPPATRQVDLLVGTSRRDAAVVCSMTKDEIVAKYGEKIANAAIGMEMLRRDGARGCMDPKQVPS